MALTAGTRLGPYEIDSALGAGGMGEVYRARDTKLHRDVALKVLPELHGVDPERLARFRREAQVLASLNHPHIGAIYGLEDSGGAPVLVLELVEGPTLAERIAQGALALDEALAVARQIADALAAAHERGIVHRDLKPANIKLRPDGAVKVLDFGLAKALEPAPLSAADAAQSPTITTPAMTQMGVIMGTAAYMSPEQAKGRPADQRSDIWAFGCVLFEMLTGRRVFDGEDVANTLALVLTKEPQWSLLPSETPPSIRRLLRRCLERDRSRRLADIADARLELDERSEAPSPGATAESPARSRSLLVRWLPWVIAAGSLAAALWLAATRSDRPAHDDRVVRSSIPLPGRLGGQWGGTSGANLALSPDGRRLVFVGTDTAGHRQLWMRTLDGAAARPLADTDDAYSPFWSPDSRWLAFVANGKLRKLDPSGGPAITLSASALIGGAWSGDDTILFTQSSSQTLARVSAAGGVASPATAIDPNSGEFRHAHPHFLRDGRHYLYVGIGLADQVAVYLASLDSGERTRLPVDGSFLQVAQGFLLFTRGSTLMAQRFDERRFALAGEAVPVAEQLRVDPFPRTSYFSASTNGILVFQEDPFPGYELTWFDRAGRQTGTLGSPADYADLSLSPDGRRAVVSISETGTTNRDLWIFDIERGLRTRFTAGPAPETHSVWSPDGGHVVFDSRRKGHRDLYAKASDGSEAEEVLLEDGFDKAPTAWSPDGRFVAYLRASPNRNVWAIPLAGDRKPFPFRETLEEFNELPSAFSPDGRWLATFSTESGRWEVYVSPFPGPGRRTQVSTAGGFDARWSRDGKEIFYLAPDGKLMIAAISMSAESLKVEEVKPLFDLPKVGSRFTYDVSPDGQRILAVTRKETTAPLTLVTNWPAVVAAER